MIELFQAALEVQQFCFDRQWRLSVIGGLAVLRWGEARTTRDVDFDLLAGFGSEPDYVDPLLAHFQSRVPEARNFAIENRVLLISASNGCPVDISLAGIPFEERMIGRASPFRYAPDVSLLTCSAEDLVVMKAFAGRPQDWIDVRGILATQGGQLDWAYVCENLAPLCAVKDDHDTPARLARMREELLETE